MNIRKTIITAIVSLTMVAMIAPVSVGAVTIADLQAQINALMAQLAVLQGQITTTTGSVPAACSGVTFTRNLRVGATGSDVKCLQTLLNTSATTQVSTTGAGSPGNETSYFGGLTLAAVKKYQAEQGWTPANQVGPLTRAKLNTWLGGGSGVILPPVIVPTGAGLSVMLASDNPAVGTVVDASALHPMLKLVFLNGDNAEVKVTGLKLKRIGVSADGSVTNTYLFNGATRLTDGAAVSETMINFNSTTGLFMVPAGGSTTISVLSNVDGTASETIGFQVVDATSVTSNASSVKGTYPLTGNLMTVATGTLAGVEWNATTTPSASSIDPQDGYTVFQNSVVVTTRAVDLTRISFRKTGSTSDTDLQNFKLYIDGVQVGSTAQLAKDSTGSSYATFDLMSAPKRLEAGTRVVKVLADIIGGSSLTFTMNLWNVADVTVVDSQYNANVLSDLVSDAAFTKRATGEQTVNSGTITFTKKADSPSGDIVDASSNSLFGKWQVKAAGEKVKIETLNVSVIFVNNVATGDNDTSSAGDITIRNGKLLANGVQIGTTTSTINGAAGTQFSFGSSLIVDPMSPVTLEFWGDVYDNKGSANDIDATDTLQASIVGSSTNNNATGQVSAATIDAPAANVNANVLTVRQGSLALSLDPAYAAHSVVAPLYAYKVADYNLVAGTSESVNLSTITVTIDEVSSYATNLYVKYGTQTTSVKPTVAASNAWSINYTLAAGATIPMEVYMDVSNLMTSGTGTVTLLVNATTASSAVTADSTTVTGQALTYAEGSLTTEFASTPQNQVASGSQTVEIGRWKFLSSYQAFTITEIKIDPDVATTATSNAEDAISSLVLKDGSTVLSTQSFNNIDTNGSTGGYFFTGLSIPVPASTTKTLTVDAILANPSLTDGTSGLRVVPALTYAKYMNPEGTVSTSTAERDGNSTYVYRSVPTLALASTTATNTFTNGQIVDLYKFKVTAPAQGEVNIKQFRVGLSWADSTITLNILELESLKLLKDGVDITASVLIHGDFDGRTAESTEGVSEEDAFIIVTWDGSTEDTIQAGASTTYTIRGTPQQFGAAADEHDSVSLTFTTDADDVTFGSTSVDFIGFINTDNATDGILALYTSATANASAEEANLIWSDHSAVAHSASTTAGTGDWTNGYLLKDSLSSTTWTK